MRACRFSSVTSAGRPANGSASTSRMRVITARSAACASGCRGPSARSMASETLPSLENGDGISTPVTLSAAERLDRDHGRQRRVDAARETEQRAAETALARVVAHAEHQRSKHLPFDRLGPRLGGNDSGGGVDDERVLGKRRRAADAGSVGREREAPTVEDEVVVGAHLVGIERPHAVLAREVRQQLFPLRQLALGIGRGRHVQHHGRVEITAARRPGRRHTGAWSTRRGRSRRPRRC